MCDLLATFLAYPVAISPPVTKSAKLKPHTCRCREIGATATISEANIGPHTLHMDMYRTCPHGRDECPEE